jgi:hypothetical protein
MNGGHSGQRYASRSVSRHGSGVTTRRRAGGLFFAHQRALREPGRLSFGKQSAWQTFHLSGYARVDFRIDSAVGHGFWKCEHDIRQRRGRRIYVETAGREQYAPTRAFYERLGYYPVACLPEFYARGDAKVIYEKVLLR